MKRFIIVLTLVFGLVSAKSQQVITLLQPETGVIWESATVHAITWQSQNVNQLSISFSANGGSSWQTIQKSYPASAQYYNWTVPAQPTNIALIRLSDKSNPSIQAVSGYFTIPEPYITLVQPQGLIAGGAYAIRWQSSCIFNLNILLSDDDGNNWTSLFTNVIPQTGIKNWPLPAAGTYLLRLEDAANPGMNAVSESFVISESPQINPTKYHGSNFDGYASKSNLPNQLQITFPNEGEILEGGSMQIIQWECQNIFRLMILLSLDGGLTWYDTIQELYPAEALSYDWIVPNTPTQEGRIRLVSLDSPGLESESGNFVIPGPFVEITNNFAQLFSGIPYPIFWQSSSISTVNLAFSADGGATWQTFAENVPAQHGIKNWTVPAPTTEGKIRIWDASNPDLFYETEEFVITSLPQHNPVKYHGESFDGYASYSNQPQALTLLFPSGGETLDGSSVQTLLWERQNTSRMMILFSPDGGTTWTDTIQKLYPAEPLSYDWTVPDAPTPAARIKLVGLDSPGIESVSGDFTIPGSFLFITNEFVQLYEKTPYPVFWNSSSTTLVNLAFSPDDGNTWMPIAENVPALRKIWNWTVPEPTLLGKIKIWDTENPDLYDETSIFVINSLPEHNPTKYHGGSFDGYATNIFKIDLIDCPSDTAVCLNEPAFEITGATPVGGTFSGAEITGTTFDPLIAGVGTHELTYQYTYFNDSSSICQFQITVLPVPEIICEPPQQVCLYDSPFILNDCTPGGGTYQGTGVAGNTFFPEIAGVGNHQIGYHFADPSTGCENQTTFEMEVLPAQWVELPGGWTGISSYMIPAETEIPAIFSGIGNKLIILYNLDGTVYYPGENLIPLNPWDIYSGYFLKTSQAVTMDFCGDYLQNLTVQLSQGWNLIPMLSKNPVSSEFMFGFDNGIKIVKEVAGWKIYWKEMNINTLGYINPGKAYLVYCTGTTSITFPYYTKEVLPEQKQSHFFSSPFEPVAPTPSTHLLAFAKNSSQFLMEGDIIAAFTGSGLCAGQVEISKENPALVMFGDDPYSEQTDGLIPDENITYRLYRPENNSYFDLKFSFDENYQNGAIFQSDGVSVVSSATLNQLGISGIQQSAVNLYPNPTTGILQITGIDGEYTVEVFNVVLELTHTANLTGNGQLDLTAFPKGIYMVKIKTNSFNLTRKVVLQ